MNFFFLKHFFCGLFFLSSHFLYGAYGTPLIGPELRLYSLKVWEKKTDGSLKSLYKKFDFRGLSKGQVSELKKRMKKKAVKSFCDGFETPSSDQFYSFKLSVYDRHENYLLAFISHKDYSSDSLLKLTGAVIAVLIQSPDSSKKSSDLKQIFKGYLIPPLAVLENNLLSVKESLAGSIDQLISQSVKLDDLNTRAEKLREGAREFERRSRGLRRRQDPCFCCCCCYETDFSEKFSDCKKKCMPCTIQ